VRTRDAPPHGNQRKRPTSLWRCSALAWPFFESVVQLLNLCDAHGIVAENSLNLPNGFHLAIAKLLAKFDAIPLLESFRYFRRK